MNTENIVQHLMRANEEVHRIRERNRRGFFGKVVGAFESPPARKAAKVLCLELEWLLHGNIGFWEELESASERLETSQNRQAAIQLLEQMKKLIEEEQKIFNDLRISDDHRDELLLLTYDAILIAGQGKLELPTPQMIRNLKDRLGVAAQLVCTASQGPLDRLKDSMIGRRGAEILGGGAIAGANVGIVPADLGAVSWASFAAGFFLMTGNTDALIKLLRHGNEK